MNNNYEKILYNSLKSGDTPNLLLYGNEGLNIKDKLLSVINKLNNVTPIETLNDNDIIYYKTNIYYEFNMNIHIVKT